MNLFYGINNDIFFEVSKFGKTNFYIFIKKISMKKILLSIILILVFSSSIFAKNATIGFLGTTCSIFYDYKIKFPKEDFEDHIQAEILGFLTAYNLYPMVNIDEKSKTKALTEDTSDYAYESILKYCKENPDSAPFLGLIVYIETLPNN